MGVVSDFEKTANEDDKPWEGSGWTDFWSGIPIIGDMINAKRQRETSKLNYEMEQENLAYEKQLQEKIFAREDNAVQRRVEDLKAAGMNPILAAGQAAQAGPAISTRAPQAQLVQGSSESFTKLLPQIMEMLKLKPEIDRTHASTQLTLKQLQNEEIKRTMLEHDRNLFQERFPNALWTQGTGMGKDIASFASILGALGWGEKPKKEPKKMTPEERRKREEKTKKVTRQNEEFKLNF